jgi:WD40 repeat protein
LLSDDVSSLLAAKVAAQSPVALATMAKVCSSWWRAARGAPGYRLRTLHGHEGEVFALMGLPEHRLLASSGRGSSCAVRLWDIDTGELVTTLPSQLPVLVLQSVGHDLLAGGLSRSRHTHGARPMPELASANCILWDLVTRTAVRYLRTSDDDTPVGNIVALASLPGNLLASASNAEQKVRLWEVATGKEKRKWSSVHSITALVHCDGPDDNLLASSGSDGTIRLWQAHTGDEIWVVAGHSNVLSLAALTGGLLASGGYDNTVRLWNVATGESNRKWKGTRRGDTFKRGASRGIRAFALLPNGVLATVGGRPNDLSPTKNRSSQLPPELSRSRSAEADEKWLAPGGSNQELCNTGHIQLWDTKLDSIEPPLFSLHGGAGDSIAALWGGILACCTGATGIAIWRGCDACQDSSSTIAHLLPLPALPAERRVLTYMASGSGCMYPGGEPLNP